MNIRLFTAPDSDRVVDIWLQGSLQAHDFIDACYWDAQKENMKSLYLPSSRTLLLTKKEDDSIVGFISLVDEYIAALFIDVRQQSRGFGKMLLDHVKKEHNFLHLKVYRKNESAVRFYQKNGFRITGESEDPATSEQEYVMEWTLA